METLVVLGLGSNKGSSLAILRNAVSALADVIRVIAVSSVYRTQPRDYIEQDDFYNLALAGFYRGTPEDLLETIFLIEANNGRDRIEEVRFGPRMLDIDIELFGNYRIDTAFLQIPHPRMGIRQFVLIPVLEILPELVDPITGQPLRAMCDALPDQGVTKVGNLYGS